MRYENITRAVFLRRPNRFIAEVDIEGHRETVHVKNTGRCKELLIPGCEVWLTAPGTPNRKTKYDLVAVRKDTGILFNIDSQAPNKVVKEWLDDEGMPRMVILALKQWDSLTEVQGTDALVETYVGGGNHRLVHPSYQAWSYAQLIRDYNQEVQDRRIKITPCACLHNYIRHEKDPLDADQYRDYLDEAPAYTKGQLKQLRDFIKMSIRKGDRKEVLYQVDHGKIRPSKSLQNAIGSMLKGNREFIMIDEQKVAYEEILRLSVQCQMDYKKRTIIVRGGPGTGKTVIAVKLLAELTQRDQLVQYVSKNSAPRQVYLKKLKGQIKKSSVDNMFKGSGMYTEAGCNVAHTLLCDDCEIIGLHRKAA